MALFKTKAKGQDPSDDESVMGLTDHLREFRNRIAITAIIFIIAVIVCFTFAKPLVNLFINMKPEGYQLMTIAPGELFAQYVKIAMIGGIVISSPVILYELFAFIRPGLSKTENSFIFLVLLAGLGFFIIGVLFAYFIMLPFLLQFFLEIIADQGSVLSTVSIKEYLSLFYSTMLMMGVVFEIPVLVILGTQLGIIKPEWLAKSRRVMIVVIFIIAAVITPQTDLISMLMVAIPMLILFEISIIFSRIVIKRKKKIKAAKAS